MPDAPASDPTERLRALLAAEAPASVLALPEPARAALADLIEDSRRRQTESLAQAFDATLKHVPFPVRGVIRKVLLG